ncbi:MAG: isoleucine--tRNA ligase [Oscillospiraceae bacterium]|jgi:isoleucyl-tRNA synthetase|nr:isoleucine--tRNA ligase [Oscillospiraceae bacterium]
MELQNYEETLNLPKTDFPMKANLPKSEPIRLKNWEKEKIYDAVIEKNKKKPLFVLHDGPPYANGDIHLGTALNKIIKDFIVRYKNMTGYCAPFIPGWDTHGLPTELKARQKTGINNSDNIPDITLRNICRKFVLSYLDTQRNQFKRMGLVGDWEKPYITLNKDYEATQIEIFSQMALKGFVYKGLRPVHWCTNCKTALAEAEIEYKEDPCYSVFVKFSVKEDFSKFKNLGADISKTYFIIWTTTTWTLPGNVAISVSSKLDYALIKCQDEYFVIANNLHEQCLKDAEIKDFEVISLIKGKELEYMTAKHPFLNKDSVVVLSDFVTDNVGTGCVHIAPGHGLEDFQVSKNYDNLKIIVVADAHGKLTDLSKEFEGLYVKGYENTEKDAGRAIALFLKANNKLLATKRIRHKYPHCWRCKDQVIFRATNQWFCSIENFKNIALEKTKGIKWNPTWGEEKICTMIKERKDWCISRQRKWGVPIPIFFCSKCSEPLIEEKTMNIVSEMFKNLGSDSWFEKDADEILSFKFKCKNCGCDSFKKEKDIMDVWFDSGVSHAAVCKKNKNLKWPYDLCFEGVDQYRGWFQSSLLTSVAVYNKAPYKSVLTHGWVVDGKGRKMSKSLGNGINPMEIIEEYGADILRLWVASSDYRADIRISKEILKQLSESYRKIRNTARFILANLYDFNPNKDLAFLNNLESIDRFVLIKLSSILKSSHESYKNYEFHKIYHTIYKFCVVDMSSFYLDVIKDRLYVESANSKTRRFAQTALYTILNTIVKIISPILVYTSDEIFKFMPHKKNEDFSNIIFSEIPNFLDVALDEEIFLHWKKIQSIQSRVKKVLEEKRKNKEIGSSLEAKVSLYFKSELFEYAKSLQKDLKTALIVSYVEILQKKDNSNDEDFIIEIHRTTGEKCSRCWIYNKSVGANKKFKTLCQRCCNVLSS